MIELTQEEIEALGLPADTTPENAYNQAKHTINSELLRFAGATGWALDQEGNIQSVTPSDITLESAEALYMSYPKFNGRPYADEASLNKAAAKAIENAFVAHFSSNGSDYSTIFDKVVTLRLSGELEAEWNEWMTIRGNLIAEKEAYKASTPWG